MTRISPFHLPPLLVVAMLGTISGAGAYQVPELDGSLTFTEATYAGSLLASSPEFSGFYAGSRDWVEEPATLSWRLRFDQAVINRTFGQPIIFGEGLVFEDIGLVDLQIDPTSDEESFANGSAAADVSNREASLLIVAGDEPVHGRLATDQAVRVLPSTGEKWRSGQLRNGSSTDPDYEGPYDMIYGTAKGHPLLRSANASLKLQGNFTIHMWYGNLSISSEGRDNATYRSGEWNDRPVGPASQTNQAARYQTHQSLRINITNGSLELAETQALAYWIAPRTTALVIGTIDVMDATGDLETPRQSYEVPKQSMTLSGSLVHEVQPDFAHANLLDSSIRGSEVTLDFLPSETVAAGRGSPGNFWMIMGAAAVAATGGVAAGRASLIRRNPTAALALAEKALEAKRPRAALRRVSHVLRKNPSDPDAWFVRGASLAQQGQYDRLIQELGPIATKTPEDKRSGLAFLLAWTHARRGDPAAAMQWAPMAARDPKLLERMRRDKEFEALRAGGSFDKMTGRDEEGPQYG